MVKQKKKIISIACKECSKEIKFYPSANRKFCNMACYSNYLKKNRFGINNPFYGKHTNNKPKSEEHKAKLRKLYLGKTYEELHGIQKAQEMRNNLSNKFKGEKNHFYGKHHSGQTKRKLSERCKGKTLEEIHGEEKARQIKSNMCKLFALENNPNWRGGKSFEAYGLNFNELFKEKIRERDNRCCIVCNKLEEKLDRRLDIHHIDYEKYNNLSQNSVSLCRHCHVKTNFNRQHWKIFFQSLLKERYGYEYTEDQKIILDFTKVESNG